MRRMLPQQLQQQQQQQQQQVTTSQAAAAAGRLDPAAIVESRTRALSLMPAGLLAGYSDRQIRDLMAYLRSSQPLNN